MTGRDSSYLGGTPSQMFELSGRMNDGAAAVQGLVSMISAKVSSVRWTGRVAEDFKADWNGNFKPALSAAAAEMQQQGQRLQQFAQAQQALSHGQG